MFMAGTSTDWGCCANVLDPSATDAENRWVIWGSLWGMELHPPTTRMVWPIEMTKGLVYNSLLVNHHILGIHIKHWFDRHFCHIGVWHSWYISWRFLENWNINLKSYSVNIMGVLTYSYQEPLVTQIWVGEKELSEWLKWHKVPIFFPSLAHEILMYLVYHLRLSDLWNSIKIYNF